MRWFKDMRAVATLFVCSCLLVPHRAVTIGLTATAAINNFWPLPTSQNAYRWPFDTCSLIVHLLLSRILNPFQSAMSSNTSVTTSMIPWLHFDGGDHLIFQSLAPTSKGAIAGACIILVLLSLLERWIAGSRAVLESKWRKACGLFLVAILAS